MFSQKHDLGKILYRHEEGKGEDIDYYAEIVPVALDFDPETGLIKSVQFAVTTVSEDDDDDEYEITLQSFGEKGASVIPMTPETVNLLHREYALGMERREKSRRQRSRRGGK